MHDLKTLRRLLEVNGVEIKDFHGAFLTTKKGDVWGMLDDQYYRNSELVDRKTLKKLFPKRLP